jgi:hypothetical protein
MVYRIGGASTRFGFVCMLVLSVCQKGVVKAFKVFYPPFVMVATVGLFVFDLVRNGSYRSALLLVALPIYFRWWRVWVREAKAESSSN